MRGWLRKDWKSKLFIASLLVFGLVSDRLWENGMVLRGGLIEGVATFFGVTGVALVIVLGTVYLCRRLVIKYGKDSGRNI